MRPSVANLNIPKPSAGVYSPALVIATGLVLLIAGIIILKNMENKNE